METDDAKVEAKVIRKNIVNGDFKPLIKRVRDITLPNTHYSSDSRAITYPYFISYVKILFVLSSGDIGYKMDCRPYNVSSQYSLFRNA